MSAKSPEKPHTRNPEYPERKKPRKTKRSESAVPQGLVGRLGRLAGTSFKGSVRLAFLGPRMLLGKDSPQKMLADLHAATAQELAETLGRLKGASMKVGQLASFVDAGVLPPEARDLYQTVLGSLRDAAPPMKPKLVTQVFEREFSSKPDEIFASFDEKPAAAASLGQVHYATLPDSSEVAVKVQYPGIESAIRSDLAMTAVVKPLMPLLAPGLDADDALKEIRRRVLDECDYKHEARTLLTLADHYKGHPFVWIPRPFQVFSSERVLTMERAKGIPFSEIKKSPQDERNRIGEILFRFYYGALHRYGLTSADPHPGNYLLMDDGRMAFFDFGLSVDLDSKKRPHLLQGFIALRDGDIDGFFDQGISMGYIPDRERTPKELFYEWARLSLAPIVEDREYTFTRQFIADRTAAMLDPRSKWWSFLRHLNLPRWAILLYRLELALFAVLAQLEASGNWHRMTMEFYDAGPPSTDLGRLEAEWRSSLPGPDT